MKSPSPGSSTLITSAPSSPSSPAQKGAEILVPTSTTRTPARGAGTGGAPPAMVMSVAVRRCVALVPVGQHFLHRTLLLAGLQRVQRGGRVVGPVMGHEVVLPRVGHPHELTGVVERVLHHLGRDGGDEGDPVGQLTGARRELVAGD